MDARIKQLWVNALESGEYKQNHESQLQTLDGRFCCLGVLCDLYVKETGNGKWEEKTNAMGADERTFVVTEDRIANTNYPPKVVAQWAGINRYGDVGTNVDHFTHGAINLASMNDNGTSFKEIAQVIKENL